MRPLQWIAMGFVLFPLDPVFFFGYDALPDFVGWLMILAGTWTLKLRLGQRFSSLFVAGSISLVTSVVTFVPDIAQSLSPSVGWYLSLPQLLFMGLLCVAVADLARSADPQDAATAGRFRKLLWAVALVGASSVVVASEVEALAPVWARVVVVAAAVAAAVGFGVLVFFIYALFKISDRDYVLP